MNHSLRQLTAIALVSMLSTLSPWAIPMSGAGQGEAAASIAGTVQSAPGQTVANAAVQLRDLTTGQLAGTTTSSATGSFSFDGLAAGSYFVEIVNTAGQIVGASAAIQVAAGAAISGVTVTASAAAPARRPAAAAAFGAAARNNSAMIITTAAAGAGIAALVAAMSEQSPSQ